MLGVWHATAIVVGTIIGSGIFLVPQEMMKAVGSGRMVYLAWIVGGLLTLFGAMTYAELGAMMPHAGGEYVFLRNAYGDLPAFLYMWTWFAVAKPASIASVTTGLARVLGIFPAFSWLDGVALRTPLLITWSQIFAIASCWLITGLNYLGIKKAGDFQLFFTWLKVVLVLLITGFCFASPVGNLANFHTSFPGAQGGVAGFMVALIASLWAYDGWNDLTMVAGEVKRPERSLPIALIAGVGIVGVLYMATNAAIQYILPAATISVSPRPAVVAMSDCFRSLGSVPRLCGDGAQHSGHTEWNHHVRRPCAVRSGAGSPLPCSHGAHSSPLSKPVYLACGPGFAKHCVAVAGGTVSAALRTRDLCRVAFLFAHYNDDFHLPAAYSGGRATLPQLGLSGFAGPFHFGRRGFALLLLCQ